MKCRSTEFLAVAALALLLAGCPGLLGRSRRMPPDRILKAAERTLPDVTFSKHASYAGNRLFAYMNGAAETYYSYGFRVMATAEAKWKATEAKVELYQLATAANAKGLYDEFAAGEGKTLPLSAGLASRAWDAEELEGIFYRGRYFCRVFVVGSDTEARQMLQTLSAAIDKSIQK